MRLGELLAGVPGVTLERDVAQLETAEGRDDSRAVGPGDLFVAVRGQTVDGHDYLRAAAERGAVAALVEEPVAPALFSGPQVQVASTQRALGLVAANRFGRPALAMTLIGVT